MTFDVLPNVGFGPLRFGMSRAEIEAVLGPPTHVGSPFEGIPLDRETARWVKGLRVMDYPRAKGATARPQVTLDGDRAVAFTVFDKTGPLMVGEVDLFDPDREGLLKRLIAAEDKAFSNGEYVYFPKLGVQIPLARFRRRQPYITLVTEAYERDRLAFNGLEPVV